MKSCYDKEDRKVERGGFFFSKKKKRTRHNRRLIQLIDGITLCDGGLIFVFFHCTGRAKIQRENELGTAGRPTDGSSAGYFDD